MISLLALLGASIIVGLVFTSTAFHNSLYQPGGGLLDGLIANGISVLLSTILIAPLTAYFVNRRREQQMAAVRRGLTLSIAGEINQISEAFLHFFAIFGHAVMAFEQSGQGNTLAHAIESLNETLLRINTKQLARMGETLENASTLSTVHSSFKKTLDDAKIIRSMVKELHEMLYREASTLENTLMFAIPVFPVLTIDNLRAIREDIVTYRGSLLLVLRVMAGDLEPGTVARAKNSYLDFDKLLQRVRQIAKTVDVTDAEEKMLSVSALAKAFSWSAQRKLSERLIEVVEDSMKYNSEINKSTQTQTTRDTSRLRVFASAGAPFWLSVGRQSLRIIGLRSEVPAHSC